MLAYMVSLCAAILHGPAGPDLHGTAVQPSCSHSDQSCRIRHQGSIQSRILPAPILTDPAGYDIEVQHTPASIVDDQGVFDLRGLCSGTICREFGCLRYPPSLLTYCRRCVLSLPQSDTYPVGVEKMQGPAGWLNPCLGPCC